MAKISINLSSGTIVKEPEPIEKGLIVGIDLGTTNSLVAVMQDGKPLCLTGNDGKNTLVPSVLYFPENGGAIIGDAAKEMSARQPERTVFSVKRLMGKSYNDVREYAGFLGYQIIDEDTEKLVKVRVDNSFYTPIELSAKILSELKHRAEAVLQKEISRAVITVPAYFNDAQRQATRDAGKLAGLDVLRIVNEPTAASLAYGIGLDPAESKTVAVYDLGGGTFDISILKIEGGVFEVLSTNGDTFLGGDDFDRAIVDHWLRAIPKENSQFSILNSQLPTLRVLAEQAKKILSKESLFEISLNEVLATANAEHIDSELLDAKLRLDRATFEQLIGGIVARTMECCKKALKDAGLGTAQIDEVVMVGGSTRVPLVKDTVAQFFGRPVDDSLNPDEVVALGAAVQADILAGNNKDFLLLDITPLSLGIETVGGLMDVIIPRNSKVPASVGRRYTTSIDGQVNLKVAVFQGERDLVADNRRLGEFILKGIPPMPAGLPKIEIHFILDADGILKVRAKEERSGVEQTVEMRSQYGISEEEMSMMLLESLRNAQSDLKIRSLIEARTEAQHVLQATDKFLAQHADILSDEEKEGVLELAEKLRKTTSSDDKDEIHLAMETLNKYAEPFAHRAMDKVVGAAMKGTKI